MKETCQIKNVKIVLHSQIYCLYAITKRRHLYIYLHNVHLYLCKKDIQKGGKKKIAHSILLRMYKIVLQIRTQTHRNIEGELGIICIRKFS